MHPRVVNARMQGFLAIKVPVPCAAWDLYVGRGTKWGNPFSVQQFGDECMIMFLDWLAGTPVRGQDPLRGRALVTDARLELGGKRLACHCAGKYPACHAEVWARLADGEELAAIRADVLDRLGFPPTNHVPGGPRPSASF